MKRSLFFLVLALSCFAAQDPTAAGLAHLARKAADAGQIVRAFLLYSEAVTRDPHNATYRANRDALEPAAKLLTQANIEDSDVGVDIRRLERESAKTGPPIERASKEDWSADPELKPVPHVEADPLRHDVDMSGDVRDMCRQVAEIWSVNAIIDKDLAAGPQAHIALQDVDLETALDAVTAATHTFVFPVSSKTLYFAADTETKRAELEPTVLLTFPLPEALDEKVLVDAANSVRGLLNLRSIGWDSANRTVMIRDRVTRARIARSVIEALLLPPAQVSFDVQFLTLDTDRTLNYGATLQTAFQIIDFGKIGGFKTILPAFYNNVSTFASFGGGATLFGIGLADATAFANYSDAISRVVYDATVAVSNRQTANFHVGDKYPIASSLYTGFNSGAASIYNPAPQITQEDLGLILKLTPHVNGDGAIDLTVEAEFKSLGTQTFNSVPSVAERSFKGEVSLREGEWAILAGMESMTVRVSRSGIAGISNIPGLGEVLSGHNRETQTSNTLLVIKPTITRLPMTDSISPQYLLGPRQGKRVIL